MKAQGPSNSGANDNNPTRTVTTATGQVLRSGTPEAISYGDSGNTGASKTLQSPQDQALQNLADTNPEAADTAMDALGYTNSPNTPKGLITDPVTGNQYVPNAQGVYTAQSKYRAGFAAAKAAGAAAPVDSGAGRAAVTQYTPQTPDTSNVDQFISDDPAINTLMSNIAGLLNPPKQTSTLMQDYKKLQKQSGLDEINEELIDADTVINGTEDDIRNEIQTAGGLATDSQVQAMSLARNKGLLKRYNQLVQMKTDATNQLNTLSSLNAQDKSIAQQRVDSQIGAMFNMATFRQQAQNNTKEQYRWLATQMGVDGLYNSVAQDPRQLAFAEKILGTGAGGLAILAATAAQERAQKAEMDKLDISYKKASIANIYSEISERGKPKVKPASGVERGALAFFNRAFDASKNVAPIEAGFASNPAKAAGLGLWGLFQSQEQRSYKQAQRAFTEARLRKESGAAIPPAEYDADSKTYFIQPGDDAAAIAQKQKARAQVLEGLRFSAGSAYNEFYGDDAIQSIDVNGNTYYVGQIVSNNDGQYGVVLPDGSIEIQ